MACNRYIIFFLGLFLASCAQVGTITGGPKDENAPRPIDKKTSPPNGSTNFTENEVEFTFDEFFRLNEANINIRMVPAHAQVTARVKGKKLFLNWDDTLQPNTTYAIYLNNAIKDVTEGNDTVMQYAFSTGPILDTLTFEINVVDAWTGAGVDKCLVGLFDVSTNELLNFAETTKSGNAKLSYLQTRPYNLLAWVDENNDLELQEHERVGFSYTAPFSIEENTEDSIPIRLFKPTQPETEITSASYVAPGSVLAGSSVPLINPSIFINGEQINEDHYQIIDDDSLHIFADLTDTNYVELIIDSKTLTDTTDFRFFNRTIPAISLRPNNANFTYSPWDTLSFLSNAFIESVDTAFIHIMNVADSTYLTDYSWRFSYNKLVFNFDSISREQFVFRFDEGAITTPHGPNVTSTHKLTFAPERKYGALIVDLNYYSPQDIIVHLLRSGKTLQVVPLSQNTGEYTFVGLEPGDYSFIIVRDANANARWDVGNIETFTNPEQVDRYSKPVKVRANWDVDVSLIPNK